MTVEEYRAKHPKCEYCKHTWSGLKECQARKIYPKKWTAKRCPLYNPEEYPPRIKPPNVDSGIVYK